MNPPQITEYPLWYKNYIDLVSTDVVALLTKQAVEIPSLYLSLVDKADFAYAEGKWTIKEMLGHMVDTERIMAYRMMRFARNDRAELPGFNENDYVHNADFARRSMDSLADEFEGLRKSNIMLIKSFSEEALNKSGVASGNEISVRALVFMLAGHITHHVNVLTERYL